MRENARTRLAALRQKKPQTKAAQIRSLWPEITAALDNGHSLKAIAECLAADGIAVSVRSLSAYVGRIQKGSIDTKNLTPPKRVLAAGNVAPSSTAKPVPVQVNPDRLRDPLANIRERQKKRPASITDRSSPIRKSSFDRERQRKFLELRETALGAAPVGTVHFCGGGRSGRPLGLAAVRMVSMAIPAKLPRLTSSVYGKP